MLQNYSKKTGLEGSRRKGRGDGVPEPRERRDRRDQEEKLAGERDRHLNIKDHSTGEGVERIVGQGLGGRSGRGSSPDGTI